MNDISTAEINQLVALWSEWHQTPDFAALVQPENQQPAAVVAVLRQCLASMQTAIDDQLATWSQSDAVPDYAALLEVREQAGAGLEHAWGLVHHLIAVDDNPRLREIRDTFQPEIVEASSAWGKIHVGTRLCKN